MQKLKIEEIIELIAQGKTFQAQAWDDSFQIKINKYVPYCCTAIHDGSNLRDDLKGKIALDEYQRWYEEDPYTGDFIDSMPITLIGLDSRFEYDLNRSPDTCIYNEAWGQKVWKYRLTTKERQESLKKHTNFYRVVKALIEKLNADFGASVVYDVHSYNGKRWNREVPLFNIGTESVNTDRFGSYIAHWKETLADIDLPEIENHTAINDVFFGRGYNLAFITSNFPDTLVLATEVKKVYCDEETGEDFPEMIDQLKLAFKDAILLNAQLFSEMETRLKSVSSVNLLDKKKDKELKQIDKQLYKSLKRFELLAFVNPVNSRAEETRFFKNKFNELPRFKYSPINISPFQLKQSLSALPTSDISDISIRNMYEGVINSFFDKIDLLGTLNSQKFLFNSLRYFGRPSHRDIQNAEYLLHLPPITSEPRKVPFLKTDEAVDAFKAGLDAYGIQCKVELSKRVISQVMVLNSKKTILIRPDAKFTRKEINALLEHEIGVHMVTTQNSNNQKLKVFNLGLPVNTLTQEGLAILAEYLSGNITLKRLKKLALRVLVVDMMCNGADFIECFKFVSKDHGMDHHDAFTLVTRIFRGGGFTKDYLYLSGFVQILNLWRNKVDLSPLLVGKTSIDYYDTIEEMIGREMISTPQFVTHSFSNPAKNDSKVIYDYIISGLK